MRKKILILFFSAFLNTACVAQTAYTLINFSGKPIITNGNITVSPALNKAMPPNCTINLKTPNDCIVIKTADNSFINQTGPVTFILNKSVAVVKRSSPLAGIIDFLFFSGKDNSQVQSENNTGGINRGLEITSYDMILPADSNFVYPAQNVIFTWRRGRGNAPYDFVITKAPFQKGALFRLPCPDTSIALGKKIYKLDAGSTYYWAVMAPGVSPEYYNVLQTTDSIGCLEMAKELNEIDKTLNNNVYKALYTAACYEKHRCFSQTYFTLQKALHDFPDNNLVVTYHQRFTKRLAEPNR